MQNETILNKMQKELNSAKAAEHDRQAFLQHINHIKLLCELFLEEDLKPAPSAKSAHTSFTEQEIKAMLGEKKSSVIETKPSSTINHDGANGDSIFDF